MKKCLCLLLALLLFVPSALADFSRFDRAPAENLIFRSAGKTSVSLLYGDERYIPGAVGMMYADLAHDAERTLPLLVIFFVHDGNPEYTSLSVTTDKTQYTVERESNLNKSGMPAYENAFHIAEGPDTIDMLRDMASSSRVSVAFGPEKNRFEIEWTPEKRALLSLAAAEYDGVLANVYESMEELDRLRIVERPAAAVKAEKVKTFGETYRTLTTKSTGAAVKKLQRYLIHYGYLKGTVDGKYTRSVVEAVKKYQSRVGISPSGKADEKTQKKLYAKEIPWTPAVTLSGSSLTGKTGEKKLSLTLKNVDVEYTVTGAEVLLRVLDRVGNPLAANGVSVFSHFLAGMQLKPGEAMKEPWDVIDLSALPDAAAVEAGIVRYVTKDGYTIHVPAEKIQWRVLE